jgi:hypothetical protein
MRALTTMMLAALLVPLPALAAAEDAGTADADPDAGVREPARPEAETDLSTIPMDRTPTVKIEVSPASANVGEAIVWKALVRHRAEDHAHLSGGADFGSLEVQDKKFEAGKPADGWATDTMQVTLVAFAPGAVEIPKQAISIVTADGAVGQLATDAARVEVKSLIANEPEPKLKDDKGPGEKVMIEDYTALYVAAGVGCAIALVLLTLLGRWLWSRRRPKALPPPPPPRPAEEIALEKLEALRFSTHLVEGRHKLFHILLSEAFREYLGNRYRFFSLERSTEELLGELKRRRIERNVFQRIVDFLSETDLVKFAKYVPDAAESSRLLDGAFALVHDTTPKPEPAPGAEPADAKPEGGAHA